MPLLDFKEIAQANLANGEQDVFELFARDFLHAIGYEVMVEPARGADGGQDIKVREVRQGIGGITEVYWLVSCKHFAHSRSGKGKSVSDRDEIDPAGRAASKGCAGFIGFYSTLPSSGLLRTFEDLKINKPPFVYQTFDKEKIESLLVGYKERENLFLRYFPNSYKQWKELYYYTEPVKLFRNYVESKYKDNNGALLVEVFGRLANAIKPVRVAISLEDFLAQENIKIIETERTVEVYFEDGKGKSLLYNYIEMMEELGEDMTFYKQEFDKLDGKTYLEKYGMPFKYHSHSFRVGESIFLSHTNNLFIDAKSRKKLEEMFQDLKEMLT